MQIGQHIKELLKEPMLYVLVLSIIVIIVFTGSKSNNNLTVVDCDKQFKDAEDQFNKTGDTCILLAQELRCGNKKYTTNPCIARILQAKGWK